MLFSSPVRSAVLIRPDARFYAAHPRAVLRVAGNHDPLVTHDFGPSSVTQEPRVVWTGGESDIFGTPIPAKTYDHFHPAIDISTGGCTGDVLAAAPGTVVVRGPDPSNAQVVVIDHGIIDGHRYRTGYVHLQDPPLAKLHQAVVTGAVLGRIGGTGELSKGCHLHFFIEKDGHRVDPWRRLAQNASFDPDAPMEVPDVPVPASNAEYLAGQVAVVGNPTVGARVRVAAKDDAEIVRTIPGGQTETWLPTCWVKGDPAFDSDRWLTRWHEGQWEYTHAINVESVSPL